MRPMRSVSFIIVTILIFLGCSTVNREIRTLPDFRLVESTLSKEIAVKGKYAIPVKPASQFTTENREVIAYLKFENLTGKHSLKWDWIDPNGEIYHSTGDYILAASPGTYKKEVDAWHRLSIRGEEAADHPGEWQVNISMDGAHLVSKKFNIEVDVHALTGFHERPDPRKWGLIIGIEDYPDFPSVDYVENDATLVKEYLVKILGVPEENIISLLGSEATKSRIKGYLRSYLPRNVDRDTRLYVYYGGHGLPYPDEDGIEPYLVPHDSNTVTIRETGYRLKDFYDDLDALEIERALVFLDTCFSGTASRGKDMLIAGGRPVIIHVENNALISGKVISLTSSSGGEISNSYPEKEHGLFTYFLLRGLRGEADSDQNDTLTLDELYIYVRENVNKISRRRGMEQTPEITPSLETIKDLEVNKISY